MEKPVTRKKKKTGSSKTAGKKRIRKKATKPDNPKRENTGTNGAGSSSPESATPAPDKNQDDRKLDMPQGSQGSLVGGWELPAKQSVVAQIADMQLTGTELAALLGCSNGQITTLKQEGMPSEGGGIKGRHSKYTLRQVLPWIHARNSKRASRDVRDMVSEEQAIKLRRENSVAEQQLCYVSHLGEVLMHVVVSLSNQHDAISGRLCDELAAESSTAVVKQKLFDELRKIRAAFAADIGQLAESIGLAAEDIRNSEAAA